jgi:hypothetical protein
LVVARLNFTLESIYRPSGELTNDTLTMGN